MGSSFDPFDDESVVDPENATQDSVGADPSVDPESETVESVNTGIFVKTPVGHTFDASREGFPLITEVPTEVTQEQADHLLENSEGLVRLVETQED